MPGPGWYLDPNGVPRWWDGQAWGQAAPPPGAPGGPGWSAASPSNTRNYAVFSHAGFIVGGFIVPLIFYLIGKDDRFVRHHAAEALNFQILLLGTSFVGILIFFVGFAGGMGMSAVSPGAMALPFAAMALFWLLMMVVTVMAWIFGITGMIRAGRGEWYRYPINLRLVKGSQPAGTPPIPV